jgi:hypothetical protein
MSDNLLEGIEQRLRLTGRDRRLVVREIESHLAESRTYLEACGRTPEAARAEACERFGDPNEVADMLTAVHRQRTPRIRTLVAATLLVAAMSAGFGAAGAFAAYGLAPKLPHHSASYQHRRANPHDYAGSHHAQSRIQHAPTK